MVEMDLLVIKVRFRGIVDLGVQGRLKVKEGSAISGVEIVMGDLNLLVTVVPSLGRVGLARLAVTRLSRPFILSPTTKTTTASDPRKINLRSAVSAELSGLGIRVSTTRMLFGSTPSTNYSVHNNNSSSSDRLAEVAGLEILTFYF
jgi:hypothetical protein